MITDEDIPEPLFNWLCKQEPEKIVEIMGSAISLMQGWNGASVRQVILESADWTLNEKTRRWAPPKTLEKIDV